jgi:quercetin dioxygenase-like cupin family protein
MSNPTLPASVMPAGGSDGGVVWNILGETYRPVAWSESCFAFDTLFPPGTFVPPHVHTNQEEFIRVLEGDFELVLGGEQAKATAGDLIRLPRNIPHGIFNRSSANVRALFWVAPAQRLYDLFSQIHNVADPAEVVRLAGLHDVEFLPPPA